MKKPGEEALIRYFRGLCTPEEEKVIGIYLAMKIDEEYVANCLEEAFSHGENGHDAAIDRQELNRVWVKLTQRQQQAAVIPLKPRPSWHAYAAAIAFLIICGSVLFFMNKRTQSSATREIAWQQLEAKAGQIKKLRLPDSSMVTLFAGAVVELPENFGDTDRSIKLTGRAFFEVRHNANKPFYVTAQGLTTRVLGTSFEVNAPGAGSAENIVTLHSGHVSIQKEGKEIARLSPDQQIRFQRSTGQYKITHVEAAYTLAWMKGELDYDQATLQTIFQDLESWYGIKITTTDRSLLDKKITISFKDLPVDRAFTMLSRSAGFSYSQQGDNEFIIKERRAME